MMCGGEKKGISKEYIQAHEQSDRRGCESALALSSPPKWHMGVQQSSGIIIYWIQSSDLHTLKASTYLLWIELWLKYVPLWIFYFRSGFHTHPSLFHFHPHALALIFTFSFSINSIVMDSSLSPGIPTVHLESNYSLQMSSFSPLLHSLKAAQVQCQSTYFLIMFWWFLSVASTYSLHMIML